MMKRSEPSAGPPPEFMARMRDLLPAAEFAAFSATFDRPPHVGLRVNTLKISIADFISIAPFSLAPAGEWEPAGFVILDDSRPGRHPYHDAGLYYLQDPSAMAAVAILAPAPGNLVLDLSAAPGGKATHLASLLAGTAPDRPLSALRRAVDDGGLLVANDVHAGRARLLADNLARWGASNVLVTNDEPRRIAAELGPIFDAVLIDAPCSGEGMFRRQEGIEWSEAIVAACARRQGHIMAVAPELVRPGGRLLYSTCTFSPEENETVIASFLRSLPGFALREPQRFAGFDAGRPDWAGGPDEIASQLARAVRLWPHRFSGEGHFIALMGREATTARPIPSRPFQGQSPSAEEARIWGKFAAGTLAIHLPSERLYAYNGRLFLKPRNAPDPGRLRLVRYGLLLGEARRGHFRPAHELALALAAADAQESVNWPAGDSRLTAYLSGADAPDAGSDGWVLVTVEGYGLGWGKRVAGRLKNHYPHHLRRG